MEGVETPGNEWRGDIKLGVEALGNERHGDIKKA